MQDKDLEFLFKITTDKYVGNFERELCAYITGEIGDCGVGMEEADYFDDEVDPTLVDKFRNNVKSVFGGKCYRPVDIDHRCNKTLIIFFSEEPSQEQIHLMMTRCNAFCKTYRSWPIRVKQFKLIERDIAPRIISEKIF